MQVRHSTIDRPRNVASQSSASASHFACTFNCPSAPLESPIPHRWKALNNRGLPPAKNVIPPTSFNTSFRPSSYSIASCSTSIASATRNRASPAILSPFIALSESCTKAPSPSRGTLQPGFEHTEREEGVQLSIIPSDSPFWRTVGTEATPRPFGLKSVCTFFTPSRSRSKTIQKRRSREQGRWSTTFHRDHLCNSCQKTKSTTTSLGPEVCTVFGGTTCPVS